MVKNRHVFQLTKISPPSISLLFFYFLRLGLTAFGGPAMIAYIKELSVKKTKWLDEEQFKDGVVLCQSIPGATAMQMAAYVGLRLKGIGGALASYVGFGLPAFSLMLIFSILFARSRQLPFVQSLFAGLQVIVVAIIARAVYSFGQGLLKNYRSLLIAALAALSLGLKISPFLVIPGAALAGVLLFRNQKIPSSSPDLKENQGTLNRIILIILILAIGLVSLYLVNRPYWVLALLMMKIDLFAFGGGFTSLPLMLHEIVGVRGWMDSKTFMDGIALGQVTPGPIVITATFIGYLLYGFWGSLVSTLSIFTPSFLILIMVQPFFGRLKSSPFFLKATEGILASFAGLLLYAAIKFAWVVPWDLFRILLGIAALVALFKKWDILYVVLIGSIISIWMFP
jgi:chromate transporter